MPSCRFHLREIRSPRKVPYAPLFARLPGTVVVFIVSADLVDHLIGKTSFFPHKWASLHTLFPCNFSFSRGLPEEPPIMQKLTVNSKDCPEGLIFPIVFVQKRRVPSGFSDFLYRFPTCPVRFELLRLWLC